MAGRPVAARGGNGMLYGLIAFVVLAVAGLGGFVWQLTSNKTLQSAAKAARDEVALYGPPPQYYREEARAQNNTIFGVVNKDLQELARLTSGKEDAVRPAIVAGARRLLREIAGVSRTVKEDEALLTALAKLFDENKQFQSENARLLADLDLARRTQLDAENNLATVREEFQNQIADLQEELDRIARRHADQLTAKDEQLARQQAESEAIGEELNRTKVQQQAMAQNHEIEVYRLRENLKSLEEQIAVLKPGGFDPYDILMKADGRVLRAIPGSDVIYIDLGQRDHVKPGLTFEVFSATAGGGRADYRGKASVEVAAVMETTAECIITRDTPGRPIVEGDVVVNIAYERNRPPKFAIRGEFDLDYNNERDWNGGERVAAIVRAWGGQVSEQIDETTDFVVLGMGPQLPPVSGGPVSDVIRSLTDSRLNQLTQYRNDIERARSLYIPIITQSQFLFLTGYAGRDLMLVN